MSSSKLIGVVIPAYNESAVISKVLREIPRTLQIRGKSYDVVTIVVNDGSSDDTAAQVSNHRRVHLINHIINQGAGAATRTGMAYAKRLGCAYAITMDADGQHHINDVKKLITEITKNKADLIIGSRLINAQGMPWYRVLGNKLLNIITFILFGVSVTDSQSGLKAFNRKALENIQYRSNNYAFCSEMIWQAKRAKLHITEIPIRAIYTDYSLSKGQTNLDVVHILGQLFKQRFIGLIDG